MKNQLNKNYELITPTSNELDVMEINNLKNEISTYRDNTKIVLNLENVVLCNNKFFEMIKNLKNEIFLVNVDSKILATMYIMRFDKYIHVFEDILSLQENMNELINRRFCIV